MDTVFLFITNIALLVFIGYREYYDRQERKTTLRILKAKDLDEVTRAEVVDTIKDEEEEKLDPDLKALDELSDEEFDETIAKQINS